MPAPSQTSTPLQIERAIARISHNNSSTSIIGSAGNNSTTTNTSIGSSSISGVAANTTGNILVGRREYVCRSTGDELTLSKYSGNTSATSASSASSSLSGYAHTPLKSAAAVGASSPHSIAAVAGASKSLYQHQQLYNADAQASPTAAAAAAAAVGYTTPSKAAALLGTISENLTHARHHHQSHQSEASSSSSSHRLSAIAKVRRSKHNASADAATAASATTGGAAAAPASHMPFNLQHHPHPAHPVQQLSQPSQRLHHNNHHATTDSLRRRNSDPTSKVTLLDVNRGNDMYQSSTHINIAGHRFHKATRIGKAEKCASCMESDAFVHEGHRCMDCKVLVHTKCIQNGGVKTLQCEAKRSKRLRKNVDKAIGAEAAGGIGGSGGGGGGNGRGNATLSAALTSTPNSKYAGSREYTDSTDKIISDAKELQLMQDFITQKICKMDSDFGKPSEVDRVFKQSLREFKKNLVAQYSVAHKQNADTLNIKYRDLIANFEQVMETCCERREDFPLTMGVNAFRGFLNEFMGSRETEKPKAKRKKEKKRKVEEHTSFNGE